MTLSLDRQNQFRERYRRGHPGWQPATEVYERLIRAHLKPGDHALDLGCGRGGVLEQLGAAVSFPLGFDPDAQSLVEHRLVTLPRAVAEATAIPLRSGSVDVVLCSWVLEHVAEPDRVFAEIARCLKPAGVFIFLTPNAHALVPMVNRVLKPLQNSLVPRLYGRAETDTFPVCYRANSRSALNRLGQAAGLDLDEFQAVPDPSYLAFNSALYSASVLLSQLTAPVHIAGVLRRSSK